MEYDDKSQVLNIITWFLLVTAFLAVLARLAVKFSVFREFGPDDGTLALALISDIAYGVCVSLAAANGFGVPFRLLDLKMRLVLLKSQYASYFFYISTLQLAKLSIIFLIRALTPVLLHRRASGALAALIVLIWIIEWFTVAFQCKTPQPWNATQKNCIDRVAFWRFAGAMNIFTDICLVVLPSIIVSNIQMGNLKKVIVIFCFGSRIADIAAVSVQLAYTSGFDSPDPSLDIWGWTVVAQVVQCVTIITTCIPYLRPLLSSLPTGMYTSDEMRRRGYGSVSEGTGLTANGKPLSYVLRTVETRRASVKNQA